METEMQRFTRDNTEGYSEDDLALLNEAWDSFPLSTADDTDTAVQSAQDYIAEGLLFHFDAGLRGEALTAFYYGEDNDPWPTAA